MEKTINTIKWLIGICTATMIFALQTKPEDAQSNLYRWFDHLGINAPQWMQAQEIDNWATIFGVSILLGLLGWWWLDRSKIKFLRRELARDTPEQGMTAIRLVIKNGGSKRFEGLVAQMTRSEPPLMCFPVQSVLPVTLATKTRLDAFRAGNEPRPNQPFNLNPGAEKHIEICWLGTNGSLEGHITHHAGDAEFLTFPGYLFHVEISGGTRPARCRIRLEITDNVTNAWVCRIAREWRMLTYLKHVKDTMKQAIEKVRSSLIYLAKPTHERDQNNEQT